MELQKLHASEDDAFVGFAESRQGGRAENQDSYGFMQTARGFLLTVCDGMGGGPGGKTASTIAVQEILAGVTEAADDEEIPNILIKAVRRANMAVLNQGSETPALKGMGSTATVLLLNERAAYVAHVGDSRIYQLRSRRKVFRTFDHSMVFELVKQKVITEEQARLSAQSNVITRALGIQPDMEVDVAELPYEKGDRFMLCSDGIHGTMPEPELIKMVTNRKQALGAVVDNIATTVDNMGRNHGGGHDNLTIAVIEAKKNSILKQSMSNKTKIMLSVLAAIAIVSVVLNVVQLSSKNDNGALKKEITELKSEKDSLSQLAIRHRDTINIYNKVLNENKSVKEAIEKELSSMKDHNNKK